MRRRFPIFVALAIAIHALLALFAVRMRSDARGLARERSEAVAEIDVTPLDEMAPPTTEPVPQVAAPMPVTKEEPLHKRSGATREGIATGEQTGVGGDEVLAGGTGETDAGSWSFSPTGTAAPSNVNLQLNGALALRIAAEGADVKKHKSTGGVQEALDQKAASLGIGAGEVQRAAEAAVRSATLGNFTSAVWEVDADAAGKITRVRVTDATSDKSIWESLVETALDGIVVSAPKGPNGVVITLRLEVADKMPSGAKSAMPTVKLSDGETAAVSGVGVGGQFDLADIGAHARRVVASHVMSIRAK